MGNLSRKLHLILASNIQKTPKKGPKWQLGKLLSGWNKQLQAIIQDGCDPVHAVYVFLQQITSQFAEIVSQMPEMKAYYKTASAAEDEYMPSGPPMSPLTCSFFTTWAFYDLRIGDSGETIGDCLVELNDLIGFTPELLEALKNFNRSRMGIYEHVGFEGPHIRLRELLTDKEFVCHIASRYRGEKGELWYIRLLPPLRPEQGGYHVGFTTPYTLIKTTKSDWEQYLKRSMLRIKAEDEQTALHQLLKYGFDLNYWNEFVHKGYFNNIAEAIFLAGIPDMESTLPHA